MSAGLPACRPATCPGPPVTTAVAAFYAVFHQVKLSCFAADSMGVHVYLGRCRPVTYTKVRSCSSKVASCGMNKAPVCGSRHTYLTRIARTQQRLRGGEGARRLMEPVFLSNWPSTNFDAVRFGRTGCRRPIPAHGRAKAFEFSPVPLPLFLRLKAIKSFRSSKNSVDLVPTANVFGILADETAQRVPSTSVIAHVDAAIPTAALVCSRVGFGHLVTGLGGFELDIGYTLFCVSTLGFVQLPARLWPGGFGGNAGLARAVFSLPLVGLVVDFEKRSPALTNAPFVHRKFCRGPVLTCGADFHHVYFSFEGRRISL
ncbi:hypothetical protein FQR65_LT20189 [Abscondita terminalis]|nr:hypothetical protein FQR65_LT20189 [Abscondita terminalis]